jgi:XRN 5'-3' exonuclease N-terminus
MQAEAELIRKGELVEGEGFDSNCITPGTEFMGRLNNHLRYFVRRKISEDPLWQKPNIILSGKRSVQHKDLLRSSSQDRSYCWGLAKPMFECGG